jgi:hypothetical protein
MRWGVRLVYFQSRAFDWEKNEPTLAADPHFHDRRILATVPGWLKRVNIKTLLRLFHTLVDEG